MLSASAFKLGSTTCPDRVCFCHNFASRPIAPHPGRTRNPTKDGKPTRGTRGNLHHRHRRILGDGQSPARARAPRPRRRHELIRLCPSEDRRELDSPREGMLEGPSLRNDLLLVDYTARLFREATTAISAELTGTLNRLGTTAETCAPDLRFHGNRQGKLHRRRAINGGGDARIKVRHAGSR